MFLLFGALAFYIIHLFSKYSGIGISPDSIMYASTAQNIHDHFSLLTYNGKPITFFPVFYPFFLNICIFLSGGATPVATGPVINGLLYMATVFTTGYIANKFRAPSYIYTCLILAAVVLSPALQQIYMYLWSETLFILEILLFLIAWYRYQRSRSVKGLVIAGIIAAICCLTRYAGITVIATGGLLLILDNALSIKQRLSRLVLFGGVGISLLAANLLLNRLSTGYSTGTRLPANTPFVENMHFFGMVMLDWFGLPGKFEAAGVIVAAVVIIALIVLLLIGISRRRLGTLEFITTSFALVYGLFILTIASISRFEQMNSRLLSPMLIPLLLAFTCWAPDMLTCFRSFKKRLLATPFVCLILALNYSYTRTDLELYEAYREYGIPGYTDDDWNKSDFVQYLKTHRNSFKPGYPIYTDADEAVYMFAGRQSKLLPHVFFGKDVAMFYQEQKFYLIDFKRVTTKELLPVEDVLKRKKMVKVYDGIDGAVYLYEGK
ncbi:hypothetical protein [Mucilaginibacter myungsuensis]|uniref:Dolichyl-phosphate-mannose-protein mannosyltransferase n=1 Tax=Mucilaginibacter myungsuensis TaxID=649104 RepID=A0A929KW61_9SPHI|nr:hypothetical protein [Mucilaginibacter myungsuensis]MBE9662726.1 hypothetical protein [Mucilaginibacter myungsuensis]MDN3598146.1 hypothetical protein [Mucilaginibacter myungsuensis]